MLTDNTSAKQFNWSNFYKPFKKPQFFSGNPESPFYGIINGYFGGKKNIKATVMACCYPPLILHIMVFIKKAKNDQVSNGLVLSV